MQSQNAGGHQYLKDSKASRTRRVANQSMEQAFKESSFNLGERHSGHVNQSMHPEFMKESSMLRSDRKRPKSSIDRSFTGRARGKPRMDSSVGRAGSVGERLFDDAIRRRINHKLKVQYNIQQEKRTIAAAKMSAKSRELAGYQRQRPLKDRVQQLLQAKQEKLARLKEHYDHQKYLKDPDAFNPTLTPRVNEHSRELTSRSSLEHLDPVLSSARPSVNSVYERG